MNEDIDVRAVPIDLIHIDPTNPRELEITPDEIKNNIAILRLPVATYGEEDNWIAPYINQVEILFGKTKKVMIA